jgi:hypothetical protein
VSPSVLVTATNFDGSTLSTSAVVCLMKLMSTIAEKALSTGTRIDGKVVKISTSRTRQLFFQPRVVQFVECAEERSLAREINRLAINTPSHTTFRQASITCLETGVPLMKSPSAMSCCK